MNYEKAAREAHGKFSKPGHRGVCHQATDWLVEHLNSQIYPSNAYVVLGFFEGTIHSWVTTRGWILDPTYDQFHPGTPINITNVDDEDYVPFNQRQRSLWFRSMELGGLPTYEELKELD